ncbi:Uncharacterised protein [uncultured archaeon]|nr:Uncharacterised protein [uncultured archaeon]
MRSFKNPQGTFITPSVLEPRATPELSPFISLAFCLAATASAL